MCAIGVVRLGSLESGSASGVRWDVVAIASAWLREMLRSGDQLFERGGRLVLNLGGVSGASTARRVARRMESGVRDALGDVESIEVSVAIAWDSPEVSCDALERRARLAADEGVEGPGVVLAVGADSRRAAGRATGGSDVRRRGAGTAISGVSKVPFVGRGPDMKLLGDAWRDVQASRSRLVGIEGDPGIGKSALLRELAAQVGAESVLWVNGEDEERGLPFGLLSRLVASAPPGVAAALEDWEASVGPRSDPLMVGAGLLAALEALSAPTLIVVDDAHAGDRASLTALGFLARRLLRDPVLFAISYRPLEKEWLGPGWHRLLRQPQTIMLRVEGLRASDLVALSAQLGTGALSPTGAARLFEHTRGHPLYARMLLEQMPVEGLEHSNALLPAPSSLAGTIVARLVSCSARTRHAVAVAAVLGMSCERLALDTVAEERLSDADVDEAVDSGLMTRDALSSESRLSFVHPLVRAAVYHDLDPALRRRLHARAAEHVAGGAGLAHRVASAQGPDWELARDLEHAAREDFVDGRLHEAAAGLWRAFELTAPGPVRTRRLLLASEARLVVGDLGVAQRAREELRNVERTAWVDYVSGFVAFNEGDLVEATEHLEGAWQRLQEGVSSTSGGEPEDLAGRVAAVAAGVALLRMNGPEMIRWGLAATSIPIARWATSLAWTARLLGSAMAPGGDPLVQLEELDALASHEVDLATAGGMLRLMADDPHGAHADLLAVLQRASHGDVLMWPGIAMGALGASACRLGRLEEAVFYTELAVDIATEAGRGSGLVVLHSWASYPHAARGEFAEAEAHTSSAEQWAVRQGMSEPRSVAAAGEAAVADARGDHEAFLDAARRLDSAHVSPRCNTHFFGPVLADALARLGQHREALESLERYAESIASRGQFPVADAAIARVRGRLEAAQGDWKVAAAHFDRALALLGPLRMPVELARTHLASGEGALQAARQGPAAYHLYAALDGFDAVGADGYASQVARVIDEAGLAARRPGRALSGLLTPAEGAVARLVAAGLTNRETAARLFVSVKAVEYHLTNIYAKLGVSSRRELTERFGSNLPSPGPR